jgi:hypothetical protein
MSLQFVVQQKSVNIFNKSNKVVGKSYQYNMQTVTPIAMLFLLQGVYQLRISTHTHTHTHTHTELYFV